MMYSSGKYCAVLAFFLIITFTGCSSGNDPEAPGILVSSQWLHDHLNDPDLVLLHAGSSSMYDSVHIPGARFIIPHDFTVNTSANRNEMPLADSIAGQLRKLGVNWDSKIVLYSEDIGLLNRTARVYVALDYVGLGDQTKVLSGGLSSWLEEGYETSDISPDKSSGNFENSELREVLINAAELDRLRWSSDVVVIDARSDEEYYGVPASEEDLPEGGHIEGAYSLSYLILTMDESPHLFRSDAELKDLFQEAGMDPEKTTLIYCNSGIKGSLNYLIARHLDYPALLYDGSFEEWEELGLPSTRPHALPFENE